VHAATNFYTPYRDRLSQQKKKSIQASKAMSFFIEVPLKGRRDFSRFSTPASVEGLIIVCS
jgi:hypothetical protein